MLTTLMFLLKVLNTIYKMIVTNVWVNWVISIHISVLDLVDFQSAVGLSPDHGPEYVNDSGLCPNIEYEGLNTLR